jgi:hypothetical protein
VADTRKGPSETSGLRVTHHFVLGASESRRGKFLNEDLIVFANRDI